MVSIPPSIGEAFSGKKKAGQKLGGVFPGVCVCGLQSSLSFCWVVQVVKAATRSYSLFSA